jgi:hypothetical protein
VLAFLGFIMTTFFWEFDIMGDLRPVFTSDESEEVDNSDLISSSLLFNESYDLFCLLMADFS